jgi:hypothetical protein
MKHLTGRFRAVLDYAEYLLTLARLVVLDWLYPAQETPVDRAIREQGERLRRAFPRKRFRPSGGASIAL